MSIEVEGTDQLRQSLAAAGRRLSDLDHKATGDIIAKAAAQAAPRRTGYLASHHQAIETAGGVAVANTARYAAPVHNGWAGHSGRPWLATAARVSEDRWLAPLETQIETIIGEVRGA